MVIMGLVEAGQKAQDQAKQGKARSRRDKRYRVIAPEVERLSEQIGSDGYTDHEDTIDQTKNPT